MRFEDKITVITGGASGIGRAIARELTKEGSRVIILDIQGAKQKIRYGRWSRRDVDSGNVML